MGKWDRRFLNIAKEVSTWSKDPSTKVGAVAVKDKRVLSTGYNGFPRGMPDYEESYLNKEEKYLNTVHAEMNTIYNASLHGISLMGSTIYVWGLPVCESCALGVLQSGIKRVVAVNTKPDSDIWIKSWEKTKLMFRLSSDISWQLMSLEEWING